MTEVHSEIFYLYHVFGSYASVTEQDISTPLGVRHLEEFGGGSN